MKKYSPSTYEEAVEIILNKLTEEEKEFIRTQNEDDLCELHFSLGMWIRNSLIYGNKNCGKLIESISGPYSEPDKFLSLTVHPDDLSSKIIDGVWIALNHSD